MGLGRRARNTRTLSDKREHSMYQSFTVPRFVRNLGKTERVYLREKTASHIESVANAPGQGESWQRTSSWESTKANVKRAFAKHESAGTFLAVNAKNGARRLQELSVDEWQAAANATRARRSSRQRFEAPASAVENVIHFRKGRKSKEDAAKSVAKDTATAGAAGGGRRRWCYGCRPAGRWRDSCPANGACD